MKNRSLKAGGRLNRWSLKAGFTVIFVLSRASKQNYIEIQWPQDKINFHPVLNFARFSNVRKYEIKYRTKICDFTVHSPVHKPTDLYMDMNTALYDRWVVAFDIFLS